MSPAPSYREESLHSRRDGVERRGGVRTIYMIKDLSTRSGLSIHTIKYYLRLGLIKEVSRSPDTNFRYFDDSTVTQLEKIREMRRLNMRLAAIKERLGYQV